MGRVNVRTRGEVVDDGKRIEKNQDSQPYSVQIILAPTSILYHSA